LLRTAVTEETFVESFDRIVDGAFEPSRGQWLPDALSSAASALGDHGLIWFLLAVARARKPGRPRRVALRALVFTGAVAPLVNSALKRAVGRVRPQRRPGRSVPVRIPRTASFPSGHALAAWCAATLLAEGDPLAPTYYGMAAAISLSRVHVRLHHATDVVAGSVLGVLLGRAGRALLPIAN